MTSSLFHQQAIPRLDGGEFARVQCSSSGGGGGGGGGSSTSISVLYLPPPTLPAGAAGGRSKHVLKGDDQQQQQQQQHSRILAPDPNNGGGGDGGAAGVTSWKRIFDDVVVVNVRSTGREAFEERYPLSIAALRSTEVRAPPLSTEPQSFESATPTPAFVGSEFRRFTVSGPGTHANAAAIITGCDPIKALYGSADGGGGGDTAGASSRANSVPNPSEQHWIWDVFRSAGFVTLVAENGGVGGEGGGRDGTGLKSGIPTMKFSNCGGVLEHEYRHAFGGKPPANYTWPAAHACQVFGSHDHQRATGDSSSSSSSSGSGGSGGTAETLDYAATFLRSMPAGTPKFAYVGVGSPTLSTSTDANRNNGRDGGGGSTATIGEDDAALAGFLRDIFNEKSPLSKQSMVLVVGDHHSRSHLYSRRSGRKGGRMQQSVADAAHATQGLLWAMIPNEMAAAEPEVRSILGGNGRRLVGNSDVHMTLLHAALGAPVHRAIGGKPRSYAQLYGKSFLLPINARDCGEPPFQYDSCACGWTEYCHADRLLGHDDAASAAAAAGGGGGGGGGGASSAGENSVGDSDGHRRQADSSVSSGGEDLDANTFVAAVSRSIKAALRVTTLGTVATGGGGGGGGAGGAGGAGAGVEDGGEEGTATTAAATLLQKIIDAVCEGPSADELVVISCPSPGVSPRCIQAQSNVF